MNHSKRAALAKFNSIVRHIDVWQIARKSSKGEYYDVNDVKLSTPDEALSKTQPQIRAFMFESTHDSDYDDSLI